ncbi:MAG: hypothetical protein N2V77_01560 [Canidatus Methanoxibalbensis ujae]|nr:hypothetical protein [Candidatus Methanoxibalbensis ujae]MCW7078414.1 hypothetical protein [Candidatus Methanoxibalbensis ujae]
MRGKETRGQMHTVEALLALIILIGAVAYASQTAPKQICTGEERTQLYLYGRDFLNILDMEHGDHTSWLYHQISGTVNGSRWNAAENIINEWNKTSLPSKGVFCKVEIINLTEKGINVVNFSAGEPSEDAVTISKIVTIVNPPYVEIYEVRLTLWYA